MFIECVVRRGFGKGWPRGKAGLASWHKFEGKWKAAWFGAGSLRSPPLARFKETISSEGMLQELFRKIRRPPEQSFSGCDLHNTCRLHFSTHFT